MPANDNYNFIRELRDKRLFDMYLLMRKSRRYNSFCEITHELELLEMPIHYLSYLMASRIYRKYFIHKQNITVKSVPKNILYYSFINKCKELKRAGLKDRNTIIKKALLSPAPCIGLSESQIRRTLRAKGAK